MLISSLAHKQNDTLYHSPVFICTLHVECIIAGNSSLIILTLMCYHVNGGFRLLAWNCNIFPAREKRDRHGYLLQKSSEIGYHIIEFVQLGHINSTKYRTYQLPHQEFQRGQKQEDKHPLDRNDVRYKS